MEKVKQFSIRSGDKCSNYECKSNPLTAYGVAEKINSRYKVITRCDLCGKFYSFFRLERRGNEVRMR